MNHINSAEEPFPSPASLSQATTTHTQGNFRISTRKLPISKAGPIDAMQARLGLPALPEMIFGDNLVRVTHAPTGWTLAFAAEPALDTVDKRPAVGSLLQVAHAGEWSSSREKSEAAGIREVVRPYDWSYSCAYGGTEEPGAVAAGEEGEAEGEGGEKEEAGKRTKRLTAGPDTPALPLALLRQRDPILFFDEVVLYESELDDNGVSVLSVKLRVMPRRMLLLSRLFLRVDNVLVRVRDTRVYVDFDADLVIREYTAKEDTFANVKRGLMMNGLIGDGMTAAMRDSNQVAELLRVVEHRLESVSLAS